MTLAIVAELASLKANEDGVILVGKTRVTLDTVVAAFNQGATASGADGTESSHFVLVYSPPLTFAVRPTMRLNLNAQIGSAYEGFSAVACSRL